MHFATKDDSECIPKDFWVEIIHVTLNGTLPAGVTLDVLGNTTMDDWEEQKKFVGME